MTTAESTSTLCQSVVTLLRSGYRGRVCLVMTRNVVTFVSTIQVSRTRRRRGRILVVVDVARVTVCDVDGMGSKEGGHQSFVVVTVNRGYRTRVT